MFEIIVGKKPVVVEIKRSWTEIIIDLAREQCNSQTRTHFSYMYDITWGGLK